MVFTIELLLEIFFGYKVMTEKDRTKLFLWFMSAMILLLPNFKLMPGIPAVNWMFSLLCLLRVYNDGDLMKKWKVYPLKNFYIPILAFHFIQPLFVSISNYGTTYFYVIQYVMTTYLYIFLGYCMAPDYQSLILKWKWVLSITIILFVIAIISKSINFNIISSGISETSIWSSELAGSERGFRVTATQASPNIFGFINVFLVLLILNFKASVGNKIIVTILCITNIFLCATRAPMVGFFSMLLILLSLNSMKKIVQSAVIALFTLGIAVNFIGEDSAITKYIDGVVDIFTTGGQNTGGSSVELRDMQFAFATSKGMESPIWGSGHGYCNAIQNEESPYHVFYDSDLAGAEGVMFYMFIDYGFVYTALCAVFFIMLFIYYYKHRKTGKDILKIAVPCTVALLAHLLSSRPDNSWQIFMPLIGGCLFMLQNTNRLETESS